MVFFFLLYQERGVRQGPFPAITRYLLRPPAFSVTRVAKGASFIPVNFGFEEHKCAGTIDWGARTVRCVRWCLRRFPLLRGSGLKGAVHPLVWGPEPIFPLENAECSMNGKSAFKRGLAEHFENIN